MKSGGKIKGPGKPDGTGPYGGTEECQLSEEEEKKKKKKSMIARELRKLANALDKKVGYQEDDFTEEELEEDWWYAHQDADFGESLWQVDRALKPYNLEVVSLETSAGTYWQIVQGKMS